MAEATTGWVNEGQRIDLDQVPAKPRLQKSEKNNMTPKSMIIQPFEAH
jgi:hypothetical protein